jgi:hypothetical protein
MSAITVIRRNRDDLRKTLPICQYVFLKSRATGRPRKS